MIQRDSKHYTAGIETDDSSLAPLYVRALVFDSEEGDFNAQLIGEFNSCLQEDDSFRDFCLVLDDASCEEDLPAKIVVINASHDNLPTSYETARVIKEHCRYKGYNIPVKVVNKREELISEIDDTDAKTLVISQCVDKNVYDIDLAEELSSRGVVIVPGKVTAPGGVFSDKDSTYKLLSDEGKDWSEVARYRKISVENRSVPDVVDGIFEAIDDLEKELGDKTFFVKPHEGGGGLGGFRITKMDDKYIIPDLSKVSGDVSKIQPTYIDFDVTNENKLRELLWIYRLFASNGAMAKNYLLVDLPILVMNDEEAIIVLKEYLIASKEKSKQKLASMALPRDEAYRQLVSAIEIFENKFNRRYTPLVNEHIDFGLWGLRAHYRLSRSGVVLEAMYHRVFQLGFTEEGLGYMGSDNISNKQTGELEILRLGPVNKIMVESIGGQEALFDTLRKGAIALIDLAKLLPEEEAGRVPLRAQLDLAAVSRRIGEGNADTSRGLSIASRWPKFIENTTEWLEDSLAYYTWKKRSE